MRQKLKTLRIRKLMDERPEGFGLLRRTPARVQQWADAAATDKAAAAADAATAPNSAAEKRRGGGLFTIWQCAGAYRRIAAHQRCGRARIESPGVTPQGSFIGDLAKLCPFSAILFRSGLWNVPIRTG
jgi:hypothetical protein